MSGKRVRIESRYIAVCECGYVSPVYEFDRAAQLDADTHARFHDKHDDWPAAPVGEEPT